MRYLGVDYGTKKVGLALSDEAGLMGFPHAVVPNTGALVDTVARLIAEKDVQVVVVGESRTLDGGLNPVAQAARAFGEDLSARTGVPIRYESEVYTTAAARRLPQKQPKSRARRSRAPVDASAAALILTSYLTTRHE